MNKEIATAQEAVEDIRDGASVMIGGFGLCGIPENLIAAVLELAPRRLHTISNNMGVEGFGIGLILEAGLIAEHTGSYVGENKVMERMMLSGELKVNLVPQGTLAESIRAGGAGIPAFYTPTGVKAWKGDRAGNLVYRKTAQSFNPIMATAGRVTIAEVDELVETGEIQPDEVMTPGIYVHRIVESPFSERRIERLRVRGDAQ